MHRELGVGMCFYNPFDLEVMKQNLIRTTKNLIAHWPEIWVIELIYKDKDLNQESVKSILPKGVRLITLETSHLMWHKEQLLNILAKRAIKEKKYKNFATFDADILFTNEEWPQRIIAKLEDYKIVQCYSRGESGWRPDKEPESIKESFLNRWLKTQETNASFPGGAWAARADFWEKIGFFEYSIIGGGDTGFAFGLVYPSDKYSKADTVFAKNFSEEYKADYMEYRERLNAYAKGNYSYVNQDALFQIHGSRADRRYTTRQNIVRSLDIGQELFRDKQGLTIWSNPDSLRAALVKSYFRIRNPRACDTEDPWNIPALCTCIKTCFVNDCLYEAGKKYKILYSDINKNFETKWS